MTTTPPALAASASSKPRFTILGAGSWGLTLATLAAQAEGMQAAHPSEGYQVCLWDRTPAKIEALKATRRSEFPVAVELPPWVELTSDLAQAVSGAEAVVFVVTAKATRQVAQAILATGALPAQARLVNASKGIEFPSLQPMSSVLAEVFPHHALAVLSGPTLAKEILAGLPTACTVASQNKETASWLQERLTCSRLFRLYTQSDVVGVEYAGSLKNVFAIASGYMDAQRMGNNARAALLTRGLAEMTRFCLAFGAEESTLYGLAGLGDLLATCNSPLSRNYQVGYRLGQGETLAAILDDMKVVAEGVHTAKAVHQLAKERGLDTPIVELVVNTLNGQGVSGEQMIRSLMSRKLKQEH